ncbi:hypothetical protein [Spongiimicrobium sp. 3-5]|uniref:hypothetical protein n=1 Tax=Spongiimicrobium sp. 3-5 TaxID=3332596 RepID=UPI00398055D0
MKRVSQLFLASMAFLFSCSDETTVFKDDLQEDVILENSEAKLQSAISYDKSGVLDILDEETLANKGAGTGKPGDAGDYPLTLVAQVTPPSYRGNNSLTASHVDVDGDYAYVAYNSVGEAYFGAIDVINISNPNSPRVTSRLFYLNADINSIKYENGYVYAAGGVNAETSVRATSNSFIAKIVVSNGRLNTSAGITYGFQQGFNANDVRVEGSRVLSTSGKDGSLTVYNKSDMSIENEIPYDDLRSLDINNNTIALLNASTGISVLDANYQLIKEIAIDSDFGIATKKTIDFNGDKIIVSEGSKGAGVYSFSSGSLLEYIPILIDPEGVDDSDVVTNAVASNKEVILMANGGAGLCLSEDNGNNADLVGIIELEGSINYVESKDDYVFAASGKEGLQIIKLNRPSESLAATCATLAAYSGSSNLNVNQGDDLAYRGSKRFNDFNVNGSLLLCGSWTVRQAANINSNALFEMNGTFVVGRNNRRRNVVVNDGGTVRIEGNLTIYGDLIVNDGATLEFLGEDSVVNIFGSVVRNGVTTVTGNFDDVRDKF